MTDDFRIARPSRRYGTVVPRSRWRDKLAEPSDDDPYLPRELDTVRFLLGSTYLREQATTTAPLLLDAALSRELDAELETIGARPRWERVLTALGALLAERSLSDRALFTPLLFATDTALVLIGAARQYNVRPLSMAVGIVQVVRVEGERGSAKFGRLESLALRWTKLHVASIAWGASTPPRFRVWPLGSGSDVERISVRSSRTNYAFLRGRLDEFLSLDISPGQPSDVALERSDAQMARRLYAASEAVAALYPSLHASAVALPPPLTWIAADALARLHATEYTRIFARTATFDDVPAPLRVGGTIDATRRSLKRRFNQQFDLVADNMFLVVVQLAFIYAEGSIPAHLLRTLPHSDDDDDDDDDDFSEPMTFDVDAYSDDDDLMTPPLTP